MGRGLVVVMVVSCLTCVPGIRRYASTFNGLEIIEFVNLKGFHGKEVVGGGGVLFDKCSGHQKKGMPQPSMDLELQRVG